MKDALRRCRHEKERCRLLVLDKSLSHEQRLLALMGWADWAIEEMLVIANA